MRVRALFAALLLLAAGVQSAEAQGFRVYKSDGTVAQFSLRSDSIVFYDGIGSDQDFGPFTPVNEPIVGQWYRSKSEWITFNADGTTSGWDNAWGQGLNGDFVYRFFPYQGNVVVYERETDKPVFYLHLLEVRSDRLVMASSGMEAQSLVVLTRTVPPQLVTSIYLNSYSFTLETNQSKQIVANVFPSDADNLTLAWESTNTAVAEVDADGMVTAKAEGSSNIICRATDGSNVYAECLVTVQNVDDSGSIDGHQYVDLQLPSGTLWATLNIGATAAQDAGSYFAWGETQPKEEYTKATYKFYDNATGTFTKYNFRYGSPGEDLEPADDAATVNWGSNWQMPTMEQFGELVDSRYTSLSWLTMSNKKVLRVMSKSNGNAIYLPLAGFYNRTACSFFGSEGEYWSRTAGTDLYINQDGAGIAHDTYYFGMPVRPVRKQQ